jgi:hypothetical protein
MIDLVTYSVPCLVWWFFLTSQDKPEPEKFRIKSKNLKAKTSIREAIETLQKEKYIIICVVDEENNIIWSSNNSSPNLQEEIKQFKNYSYF